MRSPTGALQAIVFGYACHNTTLDWYRWCGDYAGFAQEKLEAAHPGVTAMFYTGCGADQNPLPRRTVELCRKYGQLLAAGVETALAGSSRELTPTLKTALSEIPLAFERNSTQEEIDRYATADGIRGRWARRLLARQKAGGKIFAIRSLHDPSLAAGRSAVDQPRGRSRGRLRAALQARVWRGNLGHGVCA